MTTVIDRRQVMNEAISRSASNRERVANKENILGYIQQEILTSNWTSGLLPPRGLLLGDLPQIPKDGRVPECHDSDYYWEESR